jgi:plastocyanin
LGGPRRGIVSARVRPLTVTLILAALAGAGCGGDNEEHGPGGPATTVPAGGPLVVTAREYALTPGNVVVARPGKLRLRLRNSGSLPHDVRIQRGDRDLGGTESIPGGESATATVDLPGGRYRMLCTVGDHAQLGMTGTLLVKD